LYPPGYRIATTRSLGQLEALELGRWDANGLHAIRNPRFLELQILRQRQLQLPIGSARSQHAARDVLVTSEIVVVKHRLRRPTIASIFDDRREKLNAA
jgi:hypothetical protein